MEPTFDLGFEIDFSEEENVFEETVNDRYGKKVTTEDVKHFVKDKKNVNTARKTTSNVHLFNTWLAETRKVDRTRTKAPASHRGGLETPVKHPKLRRKLHRTENVLFLTSHKTMIIKQNRTLHMLGYY
jgi:hypothetical protein